MLNDWHISHSNNKMAITQKVAGIGKMVDIQKWLRHKIADTKNGMTDIKKWLDSPLYISWPHEYDVHMCQFALRRGCYF
jgi:hypothetical protein